MDKAQQIRAFQATVDATIQGLEVLIVTLKKEQECLTGNDPQRLEQTVIEKLKLLEDLQHSVAARNQLQLNLQLPIGLDGGEAFLKNYKAPPSVIKVWHKLATLSEQVNNLNNSNGQLANQGERTTRQAIAILTGRTQQSDTYNANPRKKAGLSSYNFGKA